MNKNILIVDDEKNIRMTLEKCFKTGEYVVETAVDGLDAIEKIQKNYYDLVLLDIKMPGITGMQVLERIRIMGKDVNVLIMTAYGTIEKAVEAMKLGAIDFINKPFTPDDIRRCVENIFERQRLNEDNINTLKDIVEYSKKCIVEKRYDDAQKYLKMAIAKDIVSPEPYNLLGILEEYLGEISIAQKYYRAALAMEPSYIPALKNLERTAQFIYTKEGISFGNSESLSQD